MRSGRGAILDVSGFVTKYEPNDGVGGVVIVSGGRGYATPPTIAFEGGGGTGARANCTIDQYGAIATVTVTDGGRGYNRGTGACRDRRAHHGVRERWKADRLRGGRDGRRKRVPHASRGFLQRGGSSTARASPSATSPTARRRQRSEVRTRARWRCSARDPSCDRSFERCQGRGAVVRRVDVLFRGPSPPANGVPARSFTLGLFVRVLTATSGATVSRRAATLPSSAATRSRARAQTSSTPSARTARGPPARSARTPRSTRRRGVRCGTPTAAPELTASPGGRERCVPGVDEGPSVKSADECPDPVNDDTKASGWKTCVLCPEMRNPEDRGLGLQHAVGRGVHGRLHKAARTKSWCECRTTTTSSAWCPSDRDATHVGYRDQTKDPSIGQDMGYWIWSTSGLTAEEMNKCRVSNNPPRASSPDRRATAWTPRSGRRGRVPTAAAGFCVWTEPVGALLGPARPRTPCFPGTPHSARRRSGATSPPSWWTTAGEVQQAAAPWDRRAAALGTRRYLSIAIAALSGGTVFCVDVDPNNRGMSYTTTPTVTFVAATETPTYDAGSGHGTYGFDQSTLGSRVDEFGDASESGNYDARARRVPRAPRQHESGPSRRGLRVLHAATSTSAPADPTASSRAPGAPLPNDPEVLVGLFRAPPARATITCTSGGDERATATRRFRTAPLGSGWRPRASAWTPPGSRSNTPTGYDAGYAGRAVRHRREPRRWRRPKTGAPRGASWSDDRATRRSGFSLANRDRCVLKDGTYWGEGNRELQPHGHMVEVWAENARGGHAGLRREVRRAQRLRRRQARRRGRSRHRERIYQGRGDAAVSRCARTRRRTTGRTTPGRPAYGPGARGLAGTACWPGATGCQFQQQ